MRSAGRDDTAIIDRVIEGPQLSVRRAGAEWHRAPKLPGSTVAMFIDPTVPGADLHGGVNVVARGVETPIGPHTVVFAPAGRDGAHGFRNTGLVPLSILFVYPSPGGAAPDFCLVEAEVT